MQFVRLLKDITKMSSSPRQNLTVSFSLLCGFFLGILRSLQALLSFPPAKAELSVSGPYPHWAFCSLSCPVEDLPLVSHQGRGQLRFIYHSCGLCQWRLCSHTRAFRSILRCNRCSASVHCHYWCHYCDYLLQTCLLGKCLQLAPYSIWEPTTPRSYFFLENASSIPRGT